MSFLSIQMTARSKKKKENWFDSASIYLQVKGLIADGDRECNVVLIVVADERLAELNAPAALALLHLLLGHVVRKQALVCIQHEPPELPAVQHVGPFA